MKPPGKTTLPRMQHTAMIEAERIEITQDFWVREGRIAAPEPHMVERRDDLAGVVRLIDAINSDQDLLDRVKKRMIAMAKAAEAPPAAPTAEESEGGEVQETEAVD
ncbi:MAG: hypothetical protein QHD01_31735 [Bradyrhizobium sp.]|uniref:hypothetical protein n=1 Tax=Bradyrhizobium sp. TaxID=376 RepID=UPI0029A2047B|nr:hypothetical protein [Bradyrhizobium sp.]MDX3971141.1 hypothetical protein [Bradyrhizobium sp.]